MKTEILPYQRIRHLGKEVEKLPGKGRLYSILEHGNILLLPMAFLMGRASLVGNLMPFGIALFAATTGNQVSRLPVAVMVILGMLTSGAREQLYVALASMLLFHAIHLPFAKNPAKQNFRYSIIAFISVIIPEMVMVSLQGMLLYDVLRAAFNGLAVFALVYVFSNAVPAVINFKSKFVLSNEEIISVAILASLALAGLGNFQIFGFMPKSVLCILTVLAFSFKCGPGVGASTGATVGLIISMSTAATPLVIGSYAFCGLLSGVLRNLGKGGSCLGFVMGNAILTIYLNGSTDVLIYLKEIILAMVVFLVIPQSLIEAVTGKLGRNSEAFLDKRGYSTRIKEITVERLQRFSNAFKELSKTFSEISETKVTTEKQDLSGLFDQVADRVCKDCSLCLHCWDRNFYDTYQITFKIVEKLDAKGRIEERDIPSYFIDRCERIHDFVKAINTAYELFKVDRVWKSKIGESRGLVSQQLEGLSRVISNLALEINMDLHFKSDLEEILLMELSRAGLRPSEAIVYQNKWNKYEISIFHKGCGGKRSCINTIEKLVSVVVGRKMVKEHNECYQSSGGNTCRLKLVEEEAYRVTVGVAKLAKEDGKVSGDCYTFLNNGDGKYFVALSDGMGSGPKAALQSRATITMLEQFIESGFDKDTAVKLINSILVLKSDDDCFATIDLAVIDLYEGEVEFIKIGAVPTFLKRSEKVETIRMASLPAGVLSNIEMEMIHKKVDSGDFIIMMTDGIIDSFENPNEEKALAEFIREMDSRNPQEIADKILERAYYNSEKKPRDDMMVVVSKIWKHV